MGLETATFIADLVSTNPPTSDLETQGANHLQLIKSVLQNTFGTAVRRLVGLPGTTSISASTSVAANQGNTTFMISTAGGAVTLTLPNNTLLSTDAGWEISIIKTTTDVNPIFLVPFSGTIQSGEYTGLAKARRCIPGRKTRIIWTGSGFIAERVMAHPISSLIPYTASKTLPVGFEWPNGQVLSSSANYPEYFALVGSGQTVDMRGRAEFGQDDMGGVAANRITSALNFDGTILNNTGGGQSKAIGTNELPVHSHTGSGNVSDPTHGHTINNGNCGNETNGSGTITHLAITNTSQITAAANSTNITVPSLNINNAGSGNAFTIMNPALVCPKLLVVE